jgi:hypothetical protein
VAGRCQKSNEHLASIKVKEILEDLSNNQLHKNDSASCNQLSISVNPEVDIFLFA